MSVPRQPFFPITIDDLRSNPAMIEHWPHVSRLFEGYLLTCMVRTAADHHCGERSGDESAAMKAYAALIESLEPLSVPLKEGDKKPLLKGLKRFSDPPPNNPTPKPKR